MYEIIMKEWLENNGKFSFSKASGSGGQKVNKTSSKVTLHLKISDMDFLQLKEIERISDRLKKRINSNGELVISCEEERSQSKNRSKLIYKTVLLLNKNLKTNKRRRPTKPTASSKRRKIEAKKRQSLKKQLRKIISAY